MKLIQQIYSQNEYLKEHLSVNLRIAGLSNSRKMIFSDKGISENEFTGFDQNGQEASAEKFAQEIISRNLRNSVFVDVTASSEVPNIYDNF
jgi:aspartokinase/homoserine dehydrogenase 1